MTHIYLDTYGVKLDVEIQAETLRPAVESILPPGWRPINEFPEDGHFLVLGDGHDTYQVLVDGNAIAAGLAADVAVHVLDAQLRARVSVLARERIFVHAGVVALQGQALLIPAPSFSGKSALVAALVGRGASYYSDEFAVLDESGLVHPYPRLLSLRELGHRYGRYTSPEQLRGRVGVGAARPRVIVITRYVPGATFAPHVRQPGRGGLALLSNTVPAQPRAKASVRAVSQASAGTRVLEGDRGDADEAAEFLLAELRSLADPGKVD